MQARIRALRMAAPVKQRTKRPHFRQPAAAGPPSAAQIAAQEPAVRATAIVTGPRVAGSYGCLPPSSASDALEGLFEIADQVARRLDADRQAQQVGRNRALRTFDRV